MKYCPNCGKEVQAGDKFCENCGFDLSAVNQKKSNNPISEEKKIEKGSGKVRTNKKQDFTQIKAMAKKVFNSSNIKKNPKKTGIIVAIIVVALIFIGVAIHKRNIQPDHALVNKTYVMTVNAKTTTEGFFRDSTDSSTNTFYIYLDSKNKQALSAKSKSDLDSLLKDKDSSGQGVNYSLEDNTLKFSGDSDEDGLDSLQINAIHRSGDGYTGTIQSDNYDGVKISGTVNFRKE